MIVMAERIEFDAKDVLDKYVVLIRKTGGRSPQNILDLPAPKSVIKAVLLHVLKLAPSDSDLAPLKEAYIALATFQDQKAAANDAIDGWLAQMDEITDPSMTDAELRLAAQKTASVRSFIGSIDDQVAAERALLADELVRAGF